MFKDTAQREWEKWQEVCGLLRAANAVTESDLRAGVHAYPGTSGQRLIRAVVGWGELVADLRVQTEAAELAERGIEGG